MLTVVVVSMDRRDRGSPALRQELSLARSSALYADKLIILSPYTLLVQQVADRLTAQADPQGILNALRSQRPDLYRALQDESNPEALFQTLVATVQMQEEVPDVASSLEELGRAAGSGYVVPQSVSANDDAESLIKATTDRLFELLLDPSVHAVCDATAAMVLRRLAKHRDGRLSDAIARRNREAELGAGLIARLPAFPDAPINELLDAKKELTGPLTRYRAAVAALEHDLSQEVASADIDSEIEATWRAHVAPALTELQDTLTDHALVRELARAAGASVRDLVVGGSALAIAVSNLIHITAAIPAAAGVVGAGAQAAASATLKRYANRQEAKRADFFYLYELSRRTAISTRKATT